MRVLFLSPHTDDIELGAGGTLIRLINKKNDVLVAVFSTCNDAVPKGMPKNALKKEFINSMREAGVKSYRILNFQNKNFPKQRQEILDKMTEILKDFNPELVIGPSLNETHQDHKTIAEEMIRCFKKTASIISYEQPWNNLNFKPTMFVKLKEEEIKKKISLLRNYKTQFMLKRAYFSEEFIRALAIVRGIQSGNEYAEAFEVIRWQI
ncbi:MAG: PIG-L deacetylase family protein [Candidatus Woesearchaeota archaeon]